MTLHLVRQSLYGVMIEAMVRDYESLDYSAEVAAGTMEVLTLISNDAPALGTASQVSVRSGYGGVGCWVKSG